MGSARSRDGRTAGRYEYRHAISFRFHAHWKRSPGIFGTDSPTDRKRKSSHYEKISSFCLERANARRVSHYQCNGQAVQSAGLFSDQSSKVQEGLSINDALSSLRSYIKQTEAVIDHYIDNSITYTSGANQLILKIPSTDSLGNLIDNTNDYFVFYVNQSYLHLKIFPAALSSRKAADQILSNSVNNLNFQYFNLANPPMEVAPASAAKVRISLTLKQVSATTEANLRND